VVTVVLYAIAMAMVESSGRILLRTLMYQIDL